MKSFEEIGLKAELLKAIGELGFENPMPIQEEVIPYLLSEDEESGDLIALAQTGTGKTAAFGLPLLHKIDAGSRDTQALVICPTRELCIQIADDLSDFSKYLDNVRIVPVYGGSSIKNQIIALKSGAQIVVATPGRLLDLIEKRCVKLETVENVVMDEADEMMDMGFTEEVDAILAQVPEERHMLMFSATMPDEIGKLSAKYMRNPREIVIGRKNESTSSVRHICYMVQAKDKYRTLKRIIDYCPKVYGIIFCRTKIEARDVADKLIHDGYNADSLHGDLSQSQRDYVMQRFRLHNIRLLVATDVAARGLDIDDLTHVINYSLPDETEIYTHRSGRTGRAGKTGISVAIINMRETKKIREIEKATGKTFEIGAIPTGKEICSRQIFNLMDRIEKAEVTEEDIADILPGVFRKLEWLDKEELIKRLVSLEFERLLGYYREDEDFEAEKEAEKKKRQIQVTTEAGFAKVFVTMGKMDGTTPKILLGIVNDCMGRKVNVGHIDLFTRYSLFDVEEGAADDVVRGLSALRFRGRSLKASIATDEQTNRGVREEAQRGGVKFASTRRSKNDERRDRKGGRRAGGDDKGRKKRK